MNKQAQMKKVKTSPLTSIIRSFYPTYKQENPFVYKMTVEQKELVTTTYKNETTGNGKFRFDGEYFHLRKNHSRLANDVFQYTDTNSTILGCMNELLKNNKHSKFAKKKELNALFAAAKFLTLANSPIISWKQDKRLENTIRYFFLYMATKVIKKVSPDKRELLLKSFAKESIFATKYLKDNTNLKNDIITNYSAYANSMLAIFKTLSNKDLSISEENAFLLVAISNLIKQEKAIFTSRKQSINSFSNLDDESYRKFSELEVDLIFQIKQNYNRANVEHSDLVSFITESENKIWLKDEPRMTKAGIFALVLNYLFMIVWAIIILYPIILLFKLTINGEATKSLATTLFTPSVSNFEYLFTDTLFWDWTSNTFIVATSTALIVTLFCSLLAFAYSRFEFRGKKSSIGSVLIFQLIPAGLALVVFIIYGKYFTDELKLEGSHLLVLIIIYSGGAIAGNTFLLKGYMDTISADVFDAARIDGCSHLKVFRVIAIPLAKPMMAVIFLWSFVGPFFDFLLPSILAGGLEENYTMAAGLNSLISNANSPSYSPGAYAAGGLLVSLPFAILFLGLNKQIVNGLTAGAVK